MGAIVGLLIGAGLSIYVARLDYQKRQDRVRTRANYRGSLFVVPAIFAVIGGIVGGALAG